MLDKFNPKKISFRYKIVASFLLIVSVVAAGGSMIYLYSSKVKQQVNYVSRTLMELNMLSSEMKYVVVDVQRLISNGSLSQDEDVLLEAASKAREFHNHIAEAKKLVEHQEMIDSIENLKKEFEAFYAEAVAMASLYISDLTDDGEEKMEIVLELSENINFDINEFEQFVNKMTLERINSIENRLQVIVKIGACPKVV